MLDPKRVQQSQRLARLLVKLAGDLEHLFRSVVGGKRAIVAGQLGHLSALGKSVDDLQIAWRITRQGDFVVRPDAGRFLVIVRAEPVKAAVLALVQVFLTLGDAVEVDIRRG